ncbi:two-component system, OmpR family, alkaline phosphatase synthesis response regulator PhoP [Desulfotomaculum arcticum]|uniref:Stage 0 sporulation protein A homolog n=1 Tax=Desulfotruncus arcticus DSM 17038 TaxID=1121424 RepID=A0A1I2V1D8_9FIRM|nr:response regulator transcription factor [Desulfotruncus arcticus]SFG83208.1 two-component system, OmpR family, alkaline phosphatase synthesis response regulator PhoP [Desulfotomaculum arcticum] [Desulfotruncus arcticus DSM 17038]
MPHKILVVDDEKSIQKLISYNLLREGYEVLVAGDGVKAIEIARDNKPDLIVLDIMLPGKDGFEVCKQLKYDTETKHISIIMLSAKDGEIDKVVGLEIGADDYMTKPFSPRELLARIKVNLRNKKANNTAKSAIKELVFDHIRILADSYEIYVDNTRIELPPKEFELLFLLASYPGRVFTRSVLLEKIWGESNLSETRTLDVHIRYIRQKIEKEPANPEYILTVRGVGYKFNDMKLQ